MTPQDGMSARTPEARAEKLAAHSWNCDCDTHGVGGAPSTKIDPTCVQLRAKIAAEIRAAVLAERERWIQATRHDPVCVYWLP